jgi:hypothetical protein
MVVATVVAGGCDAPEAPDLEQPGQALSSANGLAFNGLAFNGLAFNGLAFNGLAFNGLAFNGLAFNGMSFNGLSFNGLSFNGLANPTAQEFVKYLVGCALPEGDALEYSIDGKLYSFAGAIGLAPEWKTQACDETCQRWMTSCLLARLNKQGQTRPISLRGEHKALTVVPQEMKDYPVREATYYGNIFAAPEKIFVCHAPEASAISRVCGADLTNCPMNVTGSCTSACKTQGRNRSFRDCSGDGTSYAEGITVFLPQ